MSDLPDRLQRALALSRQGYSHSGIAKEMGVTDSTAKKYLRQIEDSLGSDALTDF